jgi:hypothetical protein
MPVIAISYRRQDSNAVARRLYEQLVARYGERSVYFDIQSIQPSADYRIHIAQALQRALVMLTVVGPQWRGVRGDGSARLFDWDDPVRAEVEAMLGNRRAVMPVLVNGARMPTDDEIPASLRPFRYLNAIEIRSGDEFAGDVRRLFRAIDALNVKFWTLYASIYLLLPFALALLAHYVFLYRLDIDPLYLRVALAFLSAALGLGLCFQIGFRPLAALVTGAIVGLVSGIGMLTVSFALSNPYAPLNLWDIIPSLARDWQEVIEYFGLVALVALASNIGGWLVRDRRGRRRLSEHSKHGSPAS